MLIQDKLDEIELKASVIGYLRVMRREITKGRHHTPEGSATVNACKEMLLSLLSQCETLEF